MKTGLFGGALFAAGLAAHTASAQTFDFQVNNGGAYATSAARAFGTAYFGYASGAGAGNFVSFNPAAATGSTSTSYSYSLWGFSAAASVSNSALSASASTGFVLDTARGEAYAFFTVSTAANLLLEWAFASGAGSELIVLDVTNNIFLADVAASGPAAGSSTVTLTAGVQYAVLVEARSSGGDGGSFGNATLAPIPAPGGLALAGLTGLLATRRRRHAL